MGGGSDKPGPSMRKSAFKGVPFLEGGAAAEPSQSNRPKPKVCPTGQSHRSPTGQSQSCVLPVADVISGRQGKLCLCSALLSILLYICLLHA